MIALLLGLLLQERIYSGALSYAPLERVVEYKKWQGTEEFDLLLATPDCGDVSRWAWVITPKGTLLGLIVDCAADEDRQTMIDSDLAADTEREDLVHEWVYIVVLPGGIK